MGSHMTYGTRGMTNQTEIFLPELRIPSRSIAWASLSYGGINSDGLAPEKLPYHMFSQRIRSGMTRSDWMHPPGIASMRCNSGVAAVGSQSIDSSRSARQPLRNEGRIRTFDAFIAAGGENLESAGHTMQKRSDRFLSLRSRGFPTDPRRD